MFEFDLKRAKIYQAVKWEGLLRYAGFLKGYTGFLRGKEAWIINSR